MLNVLVSSPDESYSLAMQKGAPGMVSATADGWSVDTTSASFLGVTGHWMEVTDGKWKLRSEVIGFRGLSGEHSGKNLGQYFVGVCERVGIVNVQRSKVPLLTYYLDRYLIIASYSQSRSTTHQITQQHVRQLRPSIPDENFSPGVQVKTNCRLLCVFWVLL
jgi:hypothetical protein